MEQQRELLLLLLGLQLLLMGALLCQNHHLHGFTSSLRFLTQDKPEVGEELPFVVQVSSPGIPRQDVYSNISQIHHVAIRREDLPNCPIVSPYISGPLKVMIPENLTMEQVVGKNPLVELGGQYQPPNCWTRHHTAIVVPYYGQAQHLQHLLFHLHPFLQRQQLHYAIYVVNQVAVIKKMMMMVEEEEEEERQILSWFLGIRPSHCLVRTETDPVVPDHS